MNIADEEEKEEKGIFSSDKEELQESEDQEERMMMMTTTTTAPTSTSKLRFDNSPSPSSSTRYKDYFLSDSQNPWLPSHGSHDVHDLNNRDSPNLDLIMDLRLANNAESTENSVAAASRDSSSSSRPSSEREHLFDKVVTPSDVGKLNRLVIPKQHAEKYFPLDSSSTEKGLLLNFEDGTGKSWRFRYSYWNSSQSYVMTKGWSRFVKEKKLDAGDVVSFQRGVGEVGKHRLYIDWRRRPKAPNPLAFSQLDSQNQLRLGRLYSLPPHRTFQSLPRYLNYAGIQHPHQYQYQQQPPPMYHHQYCNYPPQDATNFENAASSQYYFMRPQGGHQIGAATLMYQHGRGGEGGGRGGHDHAPVVIDSVPVVHGRSVGKRLRLFGVNMECPIQDHDSSSSATTAQQHLVPWGPTSSGISPIPTTTTTTTMQSEISRKGKSSSLSFDLDM